MPDTEKKDILQEYDRLYEKMLYLRVIANGTAMALLKAESEIYRMIQEQNRKDLRAKFQDIVAGVFWMRDVMMNIAHDPREVPSIPEDRSEPL